MPNKNKNGVLVSVIIPAYNAEKFISDAVSSVVAQTYPFWELLIIDDGSSDDTVNIIRSLAEKDDRIKLYKNETNIGVAETRNRGFDLANGEWVALLDSDDIWRSDKLEKQLALSKKTGADLIYSSYDLVYYETGLIKCSYIVPSETSYRKMLGENVIGCSTVMLRKSILDKYRFNNEFYHEDYELWLNLIGAGYKAAGCTEILVDYRVLKSSRSSNKSKAAMYRWNIYRKSQKLPLYKSVPAFCSYMINGLKKHR